MPGSMGRTSPAGGRHHLAVCRAQCMAQDPRDGAPGHHSPMPSRISGATSSSGNGRPMSTSTGRRGKNKGKAPKVWQTQWEKPEKGGKGTWPSGPTRPRRARAARGSPPTPPRFHGRTTGQTKGWRTAEIITSTTSVRDPAADPTTARSGRMDGFAMPPHRSMCHRHALTFPSAGCHRPRGFPVSVGTTGHQCKSAHRGGEPTPPEGRQSGGGQDGLRWEGTSPGCHRPRKPLHRGRGAVPARKGGSIPFPRTHRGSGRPPRETQRGGSAQQGAFQGREEPPGQASSPGTRNY